MAQRDGTHAECTGNLTVLLNAFLKCMAERSRAHKECIGTYEDGCKQGYEKNECKKQNRSSYRRW